MKIDAYDKRPLTVQAFQFDQAEAEQGIPLEDEAALTKHGVQLGRSSSGKWMVYNPGREGSKDPWQEVHDGDYIIIAPTGCRYPVQADQFERNYAHA